MAIEKKVPSPSEIIGEAKKFTPQEIQELQDLQSQISNLTYSFGQLSLNKIKLNEQEEFLKSQLKSLEEKETSLAKSLSDKYGKGSLDIETGEFTPVE
tara:strand:+ start:942 stop:1235 length:294 start_codon:yes stop_codon:yes gene_type:complete